MALLWPDPVAEYLAAEEAKDDDALSRCFNEDGTVTTQGRAVHRRDSISQWSNGRTGTK